MSKRRRDRHQPGDPFETAELDAPSFESVDQAGYSGQTTMQGPLAQRTVETPIKHLSILKISPDPHQPRRTVPHSLRAHLGTDWYQDPAKLFNTWEQLIQEQQTEKVKKDVEMFSIDALLFPPENAEANEDKGEGIDTEGERSTLESALLKIINLAISIHRDGLTNPITLVRNPVDGFTIETGERRWLAYHLLYTKTQHDDWKRIPAQIVDHADVWRQATENSARDDLNAISKARQLALLSMDLLWQKHTHNEGTNAPTDLFQPLTAFTHERDFYAQVVNHRLPVGANAKLLNALGVEHRSAITRYRKLLELADDVWDLADDNDWSEGFLRELVGLPAEDALALAAQKAAMQPGHNEGDKGELLPIGNKKTDGNNGKTRQRRTVLERFTHDLNKYRGKMKKLDDEQRQQAITELRRLADELEQAGNNT